MTSDTPPLLFNRARKRVQRDRAAPRLQDADFLLTRTQADLLERIADAPRMFPRVLDLDGHDGAGAALLSAHPQTTHVTMTDLSPAMVALAKARGIEAVVADTEALPFADKTFDLVTSLLGLHWTNDLPGALIQICRALKPDGLFLGAVLGAGTLTELRTCLLTAETELTGGASVRISPLPGLQDMAGLLQRAGFALPVADIDHVTVRYSNPFRLLDDLKAMGQQAAFMNTDGRGLSRRILARMAEIYVERYSDPDGKVRATFEIVWLSGWAPAAGQPQPLRPGSAKVSLAAAVGAVEASAGEKAGK